MQFGIKGADEILDEIRAALARWKELAARHGVPDEVVATIRRELDERAATVEGS